MHGWIWLLLGLSADPAGSRPAIVDEVIVTAQRREERSQSVPISISAFESGELDARQVHDVAALRQVAPNLSISPGLANSQTAAIAMRGQVEISNVPTVDSPVGLFLDGTYIARATGANLNLVDLERVEILRGPQGTLFGRNTIGGAINIVPHRPGREFGGSAGLLAGNYDRFAFTGVLNAPLAGDRAAARLAVQHTQRSGFARSVVAGRDLSDDDTDFIRAQFRLYPGDRWDLNLALDYSDTSASNQWITLLSATPPATEVPAASGHPEDSLENYEDPLTRRTHASRVGGFDSTVKGASATFTYPAGNQTWKAIAARRELDLQIENSDLDGTPYDIATQLRQEQAERQESVELQWLGRARRLEWLAGAYYFRERADRLGLSNSLVPLSTVETSTSGIVRNSSYSGYLQLTTRLSRTLRLQAGARRVVDRRQLTSFNSRWSQGVQICSLDPAIRDSPDECRATLPVREFRYVPFNLSIDYSPLEDLMVYAQFGRGQRAGGYNFRVSNSLAALPFEPETVDAVELGLKSRWLDGRLRVNAALFSASYEDIQLTQVVLDGLQRPVVVNVNAGDARIEGGDLEVAAILKGVTLSLGVGHTNARYTRLEPGVIDVDLDSEFRHTPAWTLSAALDIPFRLRRAESSFHVDYAWRDAVFFGGDPLARDDDVQVVSARFSTRLGRAGTEVSLWCKNLLDARYMARAVTSGDGLVRVLPADPRTFGATATWRFGAP